MRMQFASKIDSGDYTQSSTQRAGKGILDINKSLLSKDSLHSIPNTCYKIDHTPNLLNRHIVNFGATSLLMISFVTGGLVTVLPLKNSLRNALARMTKLPLS